MYKTMVVQGLLVMSLVGQLPNSAMAILASGSVTNLSGSNNVSRTNPGTVTLRWSMLSVGSGGARISSQSGRFTNGGSLVLGVNNKIISKVIVVDNRTTTETINESVRIPRSILYAANRQGLTQITYVRGFTDCPATSCNNLTPEPSITFNLTGTSGSVFGVSSYKLRFENGKVNNVITQGDKIKAIAYVNVSRTGTIRAVWEIATPSSTGGSPVYRTLRTVQRQVTGFATNSLESPILPGNGTGIYLVRLRFLEPLLSGEIPTLQYVVNTARRPLIRSMTLLAPGNGTILSDQTVFKWQAARDVSAYKIEFIEPPASNDRQVNLKGYKPVAGVLVKREDLQTTIGDAVAENLQSGRIYWWHVVGLEESGRVISQSAWRSIQMK